MPATPSTEWREEIPPDEEQRFQGYTEIMMALQAKNSQKYGQGRGLHRKSHLALPATFTVLDDLPDHCRHGLFAQPQSHDARIRLSNGGPEVLPDELPDIRGFAIKVLGVDGDNAMGTGQADCQDFLLINQSTFALGTADNFVNMVAARSKGGLAPLVFLFKWQGLLGVLPTLKRLKDAFTAPFSGYATESFHSAAPVQCGPYACRVRMRPAVSGGVPPGKDQEVDWAKNFKDHLSKGDLTFDFQLQFFTDEATTPIEDASVDWPQDKAPYVTVARLTVAKDAMAQAEDPEFAQSIEKDVFDPWRALADHRPLGNVMRVRKPVYYASAQARR